MWSVAAALALVAGAVWLRQADLPYVAVATGATVASCLLAARAKGHGARGARVTSLVLLVFCGVAGLGQARLQRMVVAWPSVARRLRNDSREGMRDALNAEAMALRAAAVEALHAPSDPEAAFAWLARVRRDRFGGLQWAGETGLVLTRQGRPLAWAGMIRAAPNDDTTQFAVSRSPFYVTLEATARDTSGNRATAAVLLHAEPPADRISAPMDEVMARRMGVAGVQAWRPGGGCHGAGCGQCGGAAGKPLLVVEVRSPRLDQIGPAAEARWRNRGAVVLALALAAFVVAAWSPGSPLGLRLAALAVPIVAVAIVPLNAFSNISPVFDPTYFYSPAGGPFTSTVAAFGVTSALAVLGALAAARVHLRIRPR